jgi:3-dehydroshikimate dehydratase
MFTLSAFADEISHDLTEQLDVLAEHGIKYLELRSMWGKNVKDLTDEEVETIKKALTDRGIGVSAIGSPLGKIGIDDDFEIHLDDLRRILEIAQRLRAPFVRIFSFYIPKGQKAGAYRQKVHKRLRTMLAVAKAEAPELVLLHENEKGIYGDTAERCLDLVEGIELDNFGAIFDPANFVQVGQRPFTDCYSQLKPHIRYLHIKDALLADGKVVPAGEGDGQITQVLADLAQSGFSGFLSLEPHLMVAAKSHGFTGPESFGLAVAALGKILISIHASA